MNDESGPSARADLHCHSSASARGVQQPSTLPECQTPPRELYELAKRRGMDFVTITDHDTIAGVLELAHEPEVFISEELTACFPGERRAVHVLCFGITRDDHDWLQAHSDDVWACSEYLHGRELACALAHPFYDVAEPLTPAHRRALAELFPIWETRNGARLSELNAPAAIYIETHGGGAIAGSDDHAGIDVGRTFTEVPHAAAVDELLAHIRAGRTTPRGQHGSEAKLAHSGLVQAARALAAGAEPVATSPLLELARRVLIDGDARRRSPGGGLGARDAWRLLRAWLTQMELELDSAGLIAALQDAPLAHADLERRARRLHERKTAAAVAVEPATEPGNPAPAAGTDLDALTARVFSACVPAVPYVRAAAVLCGERAKLAAGEDDPRRAAVITDGLCATTGLARTLEQIREHGLAGYDVDVIGTDGPVDRRLPATAEVEVPFLPGIRLGVPTLFAVADALTDRSYDLVHVCCPGPSGIAAQLVARMIGLPVAGSYSADLLACARGNRCGAAVQAGLTSVLRAFYYGCRVVLSPNRAADAALRALGVSEQQITRWEPGVDVARFNPARYAPDALPGGVFNVLCAGPLSACDRALVVEAFLTARDREPRLHLIFAGAEDSVLGAKLSSAVTFLGPAPAETLARAYASADLFLFAGGVDISGQEILDAQASALAVLAVDRAGPAELIETGRSGLLVPPNPGALADALRGLARRGAVRERLATGGLLAARERSQKRSLTQLADAYEHALRPSSPELEVPRAA